jgi:hypothetical protein
MEKFGGGAIRQRIASCAVSTADYCSIAPPPSMKKAPEGAFFIVHHTVQIIAEGAETN